MNFFGVLTMIGGVAMLLYGMHVMGEGLSKLAGSKLEKILEKLTAGKIRAILLGAVVTAIVQSSSATTVMVVGLVNSGIMKLSQAVGVIMGANVGTTMTSWILSLSGIQSGNFFIQMLKPSSFCPILAAIGVAFILFSKNKKKQDIGGILIGFSVLMFGMDTVSAAVVPLREIPEFVNLFTMFENPFLGMIVGALLTAAIQSSSASVGILQALCMTGMVNYSAALPIIMGQNIGTCVTAMLSSVGAKTNARRAALVHLYFNVIGTILFMVVFYSLNIFMKFDFLDIPADAVGIAVVHSLFNIASTIVLAMFSGVLEKLAIASVPADKDVVLKTRSDIIRILDERFLESPGFAIEKAKTAIADMAKVTKEGVLLSLNLLNHYNEEADKQVIEMEDKVDKYEDYIGTYLLKINEENITSEDSATVTMLLRNLVDLERISDHSVNILESARELHEKSISFTDKGKEELDTYTMAISDILSMTTDMFTTGDTSNAASIEPIEEVIDELSKELKTRHVDRLRDGVCSVELGFVWNDVLTNCERISDHCSNIAVTVVELSQNLNDRHEYLSRLKHDDEAAFLQKVGEYAVKYKLS